MQRGRDHGTGSTIEAIVADYLSYSDIHDLVPESQIALDNEWHAAQLRDPNSSLIKYARTLQDLFDSVGESKIQEMAKMLRGNFEGALSAIGMTPENPYTLSDSWIYWDIAKQKYLSEHPGESGREYCVADPMTDEQVQTEIVDRHIGWELHAQMYRNPALKDTFKDSPQWHSMNELLSAPRQPNGSLHSFQLARIGALARMIAAEKKEPQSERTNEHTPQVAPDTQAALDTQEIARFEELFRTFTDPQVAQEYAHMTPEEKRAIMRMLSLLKNSSHRAAAFVSTRAKGETMYDSKDLVGHTLERTDTRKLREAFQIVRTGLRNIHRSDVDDTHIVVDFREDAAQFFIAMMIKGDPMIRRHASDFYLSVSKAEGEALLRELRNNPSLARHFVRAVCADTRNSKWGDVLFGSNEAPIENLGVLEESVEHARAIQYSEESADMRGFLKKIL